MKEYKFNPDKFQIIEMTSKIASNGTPYLHLTLKKKSMQLKAFRFLNKHESLENLMELYRKGNILEIEGVINEKYNSLNIFKERLLNPYEYNIGDYFTPSNMNIISLINDFNLIRSNIKNPFLTSLLKTVFSEQEFRRAYMTCPSSIHSHHAHAFGNFEHITSMLRIFKVLEKTYLYQSNLDRDLVIIGVMFHDIGKVQIYSVNNGVPVKNSQKSLIGHFTIGIEIIKQNTKKINGFPIELENKIIHIIMSHHGRKKWGSPIMPQFPEAEIVHLLDLLDYKFKMTCNILI